MENISDMTRSITEPDWWVSEYALDIHLTMREKERKRKPFRARSPQISVRRHLVDWLGRVCDQLGLSNLIHHLAVQFMDVFMDSHSIETEQLQLVALSCLQIAAKSEEKDILIPKTSELNRTADNQYRSGDYLQMEVALLEFFNWDLVMPTVAHFLSYYMKYVILEADLMKGAKVFKTMDEGKIYARKYSEYFKNNSLRETTYLKFPPSLVAASCVASVRICLLIQPYWPLKLRQVTGHDGTALSLCVEYMLRYLEEDEKEINKSTNDSGIGLESH